MVWKISIILIFMDIILLIIDKILNDRRVIGKAGEHWVKKELKKLPKEYLVLNDLMISIAHKTCQIDHIVVSKYGIFVIETKQWNGTLQGNDYDKTWEVKAGKNTYYINNPVHQNYGHVQMLKEFLELEEDNFIPIVCISSAAKLKIESNNVVPIAKLIETITNYKEEKLSDYIYTYYKIKSLNIKDVKTIRQHIRMVKEIKKHKQEENKCPMCGGQLVQKRSRYGRFLGCSNYPKCKYIKK